MNSVDTREGNTEPSLPGDRFEGVTTRMDRLKTWSGPVELMRSVGRKRVRSSGRPFGGDDIVSTSAVMQRVTHMNYHEIYFNLIAKCGHADKPSAGYYERHHILPKSLGGGNEAENLVYLSGRAHFLAHWLLYKMTGTAEMARAFYGMCDLNRRPERHLPNSRAYQSAKEAFSRHNHMRQPEHRLRVSVAATNQWATRHEEMKQSNAWMFADRDHPMYMKGRTGDDHPRSRRVSTPAGVFGSVREAGRELGMSHPTVSAWCKAKKNGFSYV